MLVLHSNPSSSSCCCHKILLISPSNSKSFNQQLVSLPSQIQFKQAASQVYSSHSNNPIVLHSIQLSFSSLPVPFIILDSIQTAASSLSNQSSLSFIQSKQARQASSILLVSPECLKVPCLSRVRLQESGQSSHQSPS